MDILRDSIWQFGGFVLALVAIGVSIFIYLKSRHRKELSYEIISNTSLVSIDDSDDVVTGRIEILFEGHSVENVNLAITRLVNSGNVPIVKDDYDSPIKFEFGVEAEIFSVKVIQSKPENLMPTMFVHYASPHIKLKSLKGPIEIEPLLLNSKDEFTFKVLGSNIGKISAGGRIVGVKEIKLLEINRNVSDLDSIILSSLEGIPWAGPVVAAIYADYQKKKRTNRGK